MTQSVDLAIKNLEVTVLTWRSRFSAFLHSVPQERQ
jgi:hypothetical protein